MHILITGAAGFIGGALLRRLLADATVAGITAIDPAGQPSWCSDPRVRWIRGALEAGLLAQIGGPSFDRVFHLASVPGARAEAEPALGRRVNLDASLDLLQWLAGSRRHPRVVYASSVAVYGPSAAAVVSATTEPRPATTYGAHKRMVEIALGDHTRRGDVSGIALRLPGIVARPAPVSGFGSAFMSELLHAAAAAESYVCPVSPAATAWWLSAKAAVDNLLVAGAIGTCDAVQVPALHLSVGDVVDGLAARYGEDRVAGVTFDPDPRLEAVFGRYPALDTRAESALGFVHDGSVATMIANALQPADR